MKAPRAARKPVSLKRRAFFVDERVLARAREALGVKTDSEAVRLSIERTAEMEAFWKFMKKSHGRLKPGGFEKP
jgi:hypothetical protein